MRILAMALTMVLSSAAFAGTNMCATFKSDRMLKALHTVAAREKVTFEEMCNLPKVLGVEAMPSQIVNINGDVIPYTRVQLHMSETSCLYMVRDADQAITEARCYSAW
ncbi:hypothetical protein DOM22_05830 [Bdellovibrio sp. ZAP7]|uniref:hypothetical protein n=1 Tax=Bdellovibrio sp. ZAP7 TaxID=2231053 RepID=UPI00115B41A6|nr:hypothetical protein [Bdellovibrio sp. ZAP7]QDK44715.1 hypothetical protein DOM22_05830 [Bdellovibrio sp. ZAP7]